MAFHGAGAGRSEKVKIRRLIGMALPMLETSDPRPASLALCRYVNDHRNQDSNCDDNRHSDDVADRYGYIFADASPARMAYI